jgi:hypothetical protein
MLLDINDKQRGFLRWLLKRVSMSDVLTESVNCALKPDCVYFDDSEFQTELNELRDRWKSKYLNELKIKKSLDDQLSKAC